MVSHVEPPPGWSTECRQIARGYETTTIGDPSRKGACWVETDGAGVAPTRAIRESARPTTVGSQPALYQETPGQYSAAAVYWHHSPHAWASVSCRPGPNGLGTARTAEEVRDLIIRVATSVTFGQYPVRLPIRIEQLPSGYQVQAIMQAGPSASSSWTVTLAPLDHLDPATPTITVRPVGGAFRDTNTHVLDYPASFLTEVRVGRFNPVSPSEVSVTSLALPTAPVGISVSAPNTRTDRPESRRELLHHLASQIGYAADPADVTTWFDATEALPS